MAAGSTQGDYNKYTSWAARNIIVMLRAYDENPTAFGDDSRIAELGNGVPDILDEVKWALDWLVAHAKRGWLASLRPGVRPSEPTILREGAKLLWSGNDGGVPDGGGGVCLRLQDLFSATRGRSQRLRHRSGRPRQKSMGLGDGQSECPVLQ